MVKIGKAMRSDFVKIASLITAIILAFGGVTHNAFGHDVSASSGLAYTLVMIIDIGGYLLGKWLISLFTGMFAGTILEKIVEVGGGVVAYFVGSYAWFTLLYAYFKKEENRKKVKDKIKEKTKGRGWF